MQFMISTTECSPLEVISIVRRNITSTTNNIIILQAILFKDQAKIM